MDSETRAELGRLEAAIEELRAQVQMRGEEAREGGGGDGFGMPITPIGGEQGAFRFEGSKITNCRFMFGRIVYSLEDVENATADGTWALVIPHATPGSASVVLNTDQLTNLTQTVVPLFTVSNGEVAADWRGMPVVPVRE